MWVNKLGGERYIGNKEKIYFFKGHVDRISRVTIPPINPGDVITWKGETRSRSRESK
jgi:hypothetical protein